MFGVKCDGYAQPIRTSSQNRALLPRNDSRFSFPQTPTWGLTFQNEREFEYFRSFQRELVAGEAGVLEDSLWGTSASVLGGEYLSCHFFTQVCNNAAGQTKFTYWLYISKVVLNLCGFRTTKNVQFHRSGLDGTLREAITDDS